MDEIEAAAKRLYDAQMPDGDTLATLLWDSDYVFADTDMPRDERMEDMKRQTMELCRRLAHAALNV